MDTFPKVPPRRAARLGRLARAALALVPLAQGCELAEISTPAGEDLLVVEAVLRAGDARQNVLLHRTLTEGVVRGEPGARVALLAADGREVILGERPLALCTEALSPQSTDSLDVQATCYSTAPAALEVRPGERYELRIEAAGGLSIRGRTQVPGDFELRVPRLGSSPGACSLPPGIPLPVVWSSSKNAWSYLAGIQVAGLPAALRGSGIRAPELLELTGVAVSESDTTLVVPSDLGVFERFDANQELLRVLQGGFPPGVSVELLVAAADRNFVNSVRGGAFNPSGNVRISSVVGDGIGVFGSLVPRRLFIRVSRSGGGLPACLPG